MPVGRRQLLRTCGAGLVTLGTGCAGLSGRSTESERTVNPMLDGTPTATPTPEPSSVGQTRTVDGSDVTLSQVGTQAAIIHPVATNEIGLSTERGSQYLLARVTSEAPLDPGAFSFRTPAETYSPDTGIPSGTARKSISGWGSAYDGATRSSGYLVFVVPSPLQVDAARIVLEDVAWAFDEPLLTELALPEPSFELFAFDAPARIGPDEGFTLRIAVQNTGPVRCPFRAVVTARRGPGYTSSAWFSPEVGPGETFEWARDLSAEWADPATEQITFTLESVMGVHETVIQIDETA